MIGSAGMIRRAACAIFLPFAAVLLAVAPAEASVPKSAGVEQLGAAALADASAPLERASLTSSRIGLGEDLSVFDAPNAQGSLGLCGQETRRCEITYAGNNPLKYVDPDGRWVETAFDVAMATLSVKHAISRPSVGNIAVAALDVGAVLLPFVPAMAGRIFDATRAGEKLLEGSRAARLSENAAQGASFEKKVVEGLRETQTGVVEQVTVRTRSGVKTRLDAVGRDSGSVALTEAKSSATAPLTTNQKLAFPEIADSGATVVGKGKPGFPGGTEISPTDVRVVRPSDIEP